MTMDPKNSLILILIGLILVMVAAQSLIVMKLYQQREVATAESATEPTPAAEPEPETGPKPAAESALVDIHPPPAAGQPPATGTPRWKPPYSPLPYGGALGLTPGLWDPFKEFRDMRQQMDQMFNNSFSRFQQAPDFQAMWGGTSFSPSMDIEEQDDRYVVRMNIPGTDKANISVDIDDRQLTVSGHVDETVEEQGATHLRKERHVGKFERVMTLPGPVKSDEMEAEYIDGVLIITVPKSAEKGPSRRIEII